MDILNNFPNLKLRLENEEKICIAICTPFYGGIGTVDYFACLMDTIDLLKSVGIKHHFLNLKYESLIQRGRNTLVAMALNYSDTTHVFFIDSDIKWNAHDVLKLINNDKPLVAGIYPKKIYQFDKLKKIDKILEMKKFSYNESLSDNDIIKHNLVYYNLNFTDSRKIEGNLLEVKHVATGFMMIKRSVFDTLKERHPEWEYKDDINLEKISNLYAYFDCYISQETKQYLSEDWAFCERWKECGGKIYADLTIPLTHIGPIGYEGRIMSCIGVN